ncbi:Hcp family type VI secretion system effector [Mangrovitalea sediminis]|uniref:Hcp family type VI secretion system effector n=1 Tax=Mangrovitalea sediminis TaxID=1982043 RepID=UPI000BE530C0|nr:type VI secretion system tube protein Hcp [Mangrovitalea sediminis]
MSIFMNYEGIKGEVTAKGHEQWIDIMTMDWGVNRNISAATGTNKDREATSTNVSNVTITKLMDETTPLLFTESCVGKGKKVEIHLTKTGDNLENYMEYTLTDVMISGYSMHTDGERPIETMTLSFTKVEMKYTPYDDKHKKTASISAGYDVTQAAMV